MIQRAFFDLIGEQQREEPSERVINVASVPQRSPFRYPGGKTWLIPYIRRWLGSLPAPATDFIEPFAGGAIVGLTVAAERLADHVTLLELDAQIAAVWQTIFSDPGGGEWLAQKIRDFTLTPETVAAELAHEAASVREQAFKTILKNRVNRGGIMAPGAGLVKRGEGDRGLLSRWYPNTLSRRILALVAMRERVTFVQGDALPLLAERATSAGAAYFIDPPYSAGGKRAGKRLYVHNQLDHERLFQLAGALAGHFLMTYDDAPEVREMARRHGFEVRTVPMKNTHHEEMRELLVSRDLAWLG